MFLHLFDEGFDFSDDAVVHVGSTLGERSESLLDWSKVWQVARVAAVSQVHMQRTAIGGIALLRIRRDLGGFADRGFLDAIRGVRDALVGGVATCNHGDAAVHILKSWNAV